MTDLAMIAGVFTTLKTAAETVKVLRDSDLSMQKAELKGKLADITSALADAKMQLVDVQEEIAARDARIAELEEALRDKANVVRHHDAIYRVDANGAAAGYAHCLRCWEVDRKLRQLVNSPMRDGFNVCHACSKLYDNILSQFLTAKG